LRKHGKAAGSTFHFAKELSMTPLRQRLTEDMQVRNLSPHTQATYVLQVSLFARYFSKSPEALGPEEIRSYQVYLTNQKKLAPGSILIAVAATKDCLVLPSARPPPALLQFRIAANSIYFHQHNGKAPITRLFSSTSWKAHKLTFFLHVFSIT
jgi:hypothetical protein